jgi:hypothetical protein
MSDDAERAKQSAMRLVAQSANQEWLNLMLYLAREVSRTRSYFTSDDVMDAYHAIARPDKPVTHELRAMGPVMVQAARLGYCQKADCAPIPSRRRSLHASPRAVWQSLIHRQTKEYRNA